MSFDIALSTAQARAQVGKLTASIKGLERAADGASAKLQRSLGAMGGAQQFTEMNTSLNGIRSQLINMGAQWERTYSAATKSSNTLQNSVHKGTGTLDTGKKAVNQYGDSLLTTSQKAAILRSSMLALGTHVGIFTASTLLAATAAYGTVKAIQGIITVGAQYTQSLAQISSITGESRQGLQGLSMDMLDLAEKTKFTTTEVGEAAVILGKTGMKTVEISEALGPVLNLASIGTMSMAKAADIAANSMFGFQKETKDLTEIVDVLAFTATNSNSTVEQLGNSMSYAAAVSAAAGAKFEDVAAMLAVMHNAGVKGSKAGTTLRRAYLNLLDPSDRVIGIMKDLNVSLTDSGGNMRSLIDIMRDFAKAGGNAVDIKDMFGIRAVPGMISLWKDLARGIAGGSSTVEEFAARSDEISGSAERMREAAEKNLIDVWKKFKSVVSVQATAAFLEMEAGLTSSVEGMTEFFKATVDMQEVIQTGSAYLETWAYLFSQVGEGMQRVGDMMPRQIAAWSEFNSRMASLTFKGLADLPVNLTAIAKIVGVVIGSIVASIDELGIKWDIFTESLSHSFLSLDPVFEWLSDKLFWMADQAKSIGMGGMASALEKAGLSVYEYRGGDGPSKMQQAEQERHDAAMKRLNDELNLKEKIRKQVGDGMISEILKETDASLKARDATIARTKAMIEWDREAERIFALMDKFNLPSDENITMPKQRQKPTGPAEDILKTSSRQLTDFIKLQKQSVEVAESQITHLEKMGQISPFEALSAGMEKSKNSLDAIEKKFAELIKPLLYWQKAFKDSRYNSTEAEGYTKAIAKVIQAYNEQTAQIRKGATEQGFALEQLRSKYEMVTDADVKYKVQMKTGTLGGSDPVAFMDSLRNDSMSEADKIQREAQDKLAKLEEVHGMEMQLQEGQQAQALISEQEYLKQKQLITDNALRAKYALTADYYKKEALLEENLHVAKTKSAVDGIASYTEAGAKSSKKLFEINKKAKIAMILLDTPSAIAGAYAHGATLGGPILGATFAALAFANQAAMLQQASSVTFAGGGSASPPPATSSSTPTYPDIAPQSDAIFNQTNTGGTRNTVDSTPVGDLNVNFQINAVDAKGIDALLAQRRPQIVSMVQSAYSERGKRGGPLA